MILTSKQAQLLEKIVNAKLTKEELSSVIKKAENIIKNRKNP